MKPCAASRSITPKNFQYQLTHLAIFQRLVDKLPSSKTAWSNCRPVGQFRPANNHSDYDKVAMRPENSGHVRNSGVLSRDNIAVRKFAQM